jgi:two-component system sensor histidine kinase BaeS
MRSTIHEMRNQLAVAVANIEAFIDGKLQPTPDRLGAVLQALNELDVLMNDLRANPEVKIDHVDVKKPVDVCALIVNETIAIEATAAEHGVDFVVHRCSVKHAACEAFVCDPVRVGQAIKNVLLNAVKYTPAGGRVILDCHREPGVMAFSVADSGPGVALEERERIFQPGIRGSAAGVTSGSGMGLAVVREIVNAHGGTVSVENGELGGATFVVRLPGEPVPNSTCADCACDEGPSQLLRESATRLA